jgi:hypothetical protein
MEAPSGFEPENNGFADRPLSHLGMAPLFNGQKRLADRLTPIQVRDFVEDLFPEREIVAVRKNRPSLKGEF